MTTSVPTSPRERQQWVLFQLKLIGESFASVGVREGVSKSAVRQALTEPSYRIEIALAKTLGLKPRELFPERYGARGRRLHQVRGQKARMAA